MAYDFDGLFIFEMANNHQGMVGHGLRIVDEMSKIARAHGITASVKLQYRDLDTFIHPDYAGRSDVKHIPRFRETKLSAEQLGELAGAIRDRGLKLVITPFDEPSVDLAIRHGVDVLKVASCSAMDWPLLEVIARAGKPIICSTGGLSIHDVDKVVNFFEHRNVSDLAILHCVSVYPTPNKDQHLAFMKRMIQRYPNHAIGYSGHEAPTNLDVVRVAVALGAKILERHVGVPTDSIKLNAYSMNPDETDTWVATALDTQAMLGSADKRLTREESDSLRSLMRGVFAKQPIAPGETIDRSKVFFAMPCDPSQTTSGEYQETMTASRAYEAGQAVEERRPYSPIHHVRSIVHDAKGLLREAKIAIGPVFTVELSHHFGMDEFRKTGAIIVNMVNREYCKKLIILLPGQSHPSHSHQKKEETFQILHGDLELDLEGTKKTLQAGDIQLVERGQAHSFSTRGGCVFEEISTTHVVGDSYYSDERISRLDPMQRKTILQNW